MRVPRAPDRLLERSIIVRGFCCARYMGSTLAILSCITVGTALFETIGTLYPVLSTMATDVA